MGTGRPCSICSSAEKLRIAAELIAAGATDQAIATRLGGGLHRMAVSRHRRQHVVAPAKALAEAAGKGRDAVEQRTQIMAAAEAGDPSAFIALAGIVADLRRVHDRLERTADAAERDNQRHAVAGLSAQQLRAAEVRAKIGGVGSYAPPKVSGGGDGQQFSVTINLPGGQVERITTIDGDTGRSPPGAVNPELVEDYAAPDAELLDTGPESAAVANLVRAFGHHSR